MPKPVATQVTLTMTREAFDQIKGFIGILSDAVDAAEAKIKADEAQAGAAQKGQDVADQISPPAQPDAGGLGGFGDALTASSNQQNGLGA